MNKAFKRFVRRRPTHRSEIRDGNGALLFVMESFTRKLSNDEMKRVRPRYESGAHIVKPLSCRVFKIKG